MKIPLFLKWFFSGNKKVIAIRNTGFGDCLLMTAVAWRYAKTTGRDLLILWLHSPYMPRSNENAFFHYFDFPTTLDGVSIPKISRLDFFSYCVIYYPFIYKPFIVSRNFFAGFLLKLFNKPLSPAGKKRLEEDADKERAVLVNLVDLKRKIVGVCACYGPTHAEGTQSFFEAIKPKKVAQTKIEEFARKHFSGKKVIGVHTRYRHRTLLGQFDNSKNWKDDTQVRDTLNNLLNLIKKALKKFPEEETIVFLSTDSDVVWNFLKGKLSNLLVYPKQFGKLEEEYHDRYVAANVEATLCEMFLLGQSDLLIRFPNPSWFSYYASLKAKEVWT